uniref:Uncharacterized protein n=1 Tax=Zea mays TaxID=4577 RepID=C0HJ32_MAIZE|nr:unknown [Zea mays]
MSNLSHHIELNESSDLCLFKLLEEDTEYGASLPLVLFSFAISFELSAVVLAPSPFAWSLLYTRLSRSQNFTTLCLYPFASLFLYKKIVTKIHQQINLELKHKLSCKKWNKLLGNSSMYDQFAGLTSLAQDF